MQAGVLKRRPPLTPIKYVLDGALRNLVSVDGEYNVELAIYKRLIESCLMRTMIECFTTQDDHVTVDTVQAVAGEVGVVQVQRSGGPRETEYLHVYVRVLCQRMRLEMEAALNDGALRPSIDRFVFSVHAVEVTEVQPATTTTKHYRRTALKHPIDEA